MDESERAPQPRAFFDIESNTVPEGNPTLPPASLWVGQMDSGSPASHQTSTVGAGHPPQGSAFFSGEVTAMPGGALAFEPVAAKERPRWGRFFLGMFGPWLVVLLMTLATGFSSANWEDFEAHESVSGSGDNNGTVTLQLSPPSAAHEVNFNHYDWDEGVDIYMYYSPYYGDEGRLTVPVRDNRAEIGTYDTQTGVLTFTHNHFVNSTLTTFDVWYYDQAGYNDANDGGEMLAFIGSCCLPLAYIGGTVMAFVRGEKHLAWGLVSAIPAGLVMVPVMLVGALMLWGF
jgi:hypothetical protein